MKSLVKIVVVLLVLAGLAVGGTFLYKYLTREPTSTFRLAAVKRGDLMATISSTGTVEPEEVVDIGAQVAGVINAFGKDAAGKPIDYGSVVDEGMVLAQIDDSLYASDVAAASATLAQAKATQVLAEANLVQMNAKLEEASNDWDRAQKLGSGAALAATQYDAYKSTYEVAKANVAVAKASIVQATAGVSQAQASLDRAQRNLGYCTIKSPVKGVIIDRRVNIGQTVVSSLSAPSLFLLAKDLTRMQVWVAVNEADIGQIHPGQAATFTADAFPGEKFQGEVIKTRLNASMTSNVVTYTVEILTDNSSGRLLPYLTANVQFDVSHRTGVLMVPNAALRWFPQPEQVAPEFQSELASLSRRGGGAASADPAKGDNTTKGAESTTGTDPGKGAGTATGTDAGKGAGTAKGAGAGKGTGGRMSNGVVWTVENGLVKPIRVKVGLTDGVQTEVSGEGLAEGTDVVIGEQQAQPAASSDTKNPFAPQFPGRGNRSSTGSSSGKS